MPQVTGSLLLYHNRISGFLPPKLPVGGCPTENYPCYLDLSEQPISGFLPPDLRVLGTGGRYVTITASSAKLSGVIPSQLGMLTAAVGPVRHGESYALKLNLDINDFQLSVPTEVGALCELGAARRSNR